MISMSEVKQDIIKNLNNGLVVEGLGSIETNEKGVTKIEQEIFLTKDQVLQIAGAADRINYTSSLESRIGKMRDILIKTKLLSKENTIKGIIRASDLYVEKLECEVQEVQELIKAVLPFADYESNYVKDKALENLKELEEYIIFLKHCIEGMGHLEDFIDKTK